MKELNVVRPGVCKVFDPTGTDKMRFWPGSVLSVKRWLGLVPYVRAVQYRTVEWDASHGDLDCYPCVTVLDKT